MQPTTKILLLVGMGGFFGAIARYSLSGLASRFADTAFPLGTMVVNLVGCLAVGALMCLVKERQLFTPGLRMLLLVGFLGSFTTFSAFGFETLELLRRSDHRLALVNILANLALGIGAVWVGWAGVKAWSN